MRLIFLVAVMLCAPVGAQRVYGLGTGGAYVACWDGALVHNASSRRRRGKAKKPHPSEGPYDSAWLEAQLVRLLNDWSDEVPDHVVSGSQSGKYKVRKNWFHGVGLGFEIAVARKFVEDPKLIADLAVHAAHIRTFGSIGLVPDPAENITRTNRMIRRVIRELRLRRPKK